MSTRRRDGGAAGDAPRSPCGTGFADGNGRLESARVRIAVDARELCGQPTGVGRYLAEIIAAWQELPGAAAHEFVLCAPEAVPLPGTSSLRITVRTSPGRGTRWEQLVLPRLAGDAGILFAPGYSAPLRLAAPMVVTIHDVSFAAHPEWFSWREGTRRRLLTRLAARRAARVITVSDFSKREIVRHLGVAPSKVDVVYSGVTRLPDVPPAPRDPLVLYVGSLFNRRHVAELIDGFTRLAQRHPEVRLDIVGDNRTRPFVDVGALATRSRARDRIRVRAYVTDGELASLYARASAFAFLSEYEGFAMTPLEALGAGIPIALLDTEVAREIYGPSAAYIERPDPDLIANALERLLRDGAERQRLLDSAATQMERYSWQECARRTLQILLAAGAR
jgi:glycosyltransferase involved in cell wall biosynthesis